MLLQQSSTPLLVLLAVCVTVSYTAAFSTIYQQTSAFKVSKISKLFSTPTEVSTYSLELEKPLGIVLEEVTENASDGVYVESVNEGGSAYEYAEKLQGLKLMKVMDDDVTSITFDEVMEKIISAPATVTIDFELIDETEEANSGYEVGTDVLIKVLEESKESVIEAKVGDNLRKKLLENKIELYKGLKKKLGNCGGSGRCAFH